MASRDKWVKARLSDEERAAMDEVKRIYGTESDSEIIRLLVQYALSKRPTLTPAALRPLGKSVARQSMTA